jgi:hypothetical protein
MDLNRHLMNNYPFTENEQDYLAAKFHIDETHIVQASHLAFLKIQSWKFALKTPSVGSRFKNEAAEMLEQSFFEFLSTNSILEKEHFGEIPLN